jgi:hypothetical protein
MKTKNFLMTLIAVPLLFGSALSQEAGSGNTMRCLTSDGTITIKGNTIQMRDYTMTVQNVERDGVIRMADANNEVSAVLDTRDPEGLYLAITEDGRKMQVVAPRDGMIFGDSRFNAASAPANPEYDIVKEISVNYNMDARTLSVLSR